MQKFKSKIFTIAAVLFFIGFFDVQKVFASDPTAEPLIQQSNLQYVGAFRVPGDRQGCLSYDDCSFHFGGGGFSFNPSNNSVFMMSHSSKMAELNIPNLVNSSDLNDLNTATFRQLFADLSEGNRDNITADGSPIGNGGVIGGTLPIGNKLLLSDFGYYDAAYQAVYSHFLANIDWTNNGTGFSGMKTIGTPPAENVGFTAGYMGNIPSKWQTLLGGSVLTGNANLAIISRTSMGPSVFSFDPSQLESSSLISASALVEYPGGHRTLGDYGATNSYVTTADQIRGVVFPSGSRSVLFFGRHGTNRSCYGLGTSDQSMVKDAAQLSAWFLANPVAQYYQCGSGQIYPNEIGADDCCFDTVSDKGTHSYPYVYQVWAYDANDMLAAKNGSKKPWEILPYAVWSLNLPFQQDQASVGGVGYDPQTNRIYISAQSTDNNGSMYYDNPLVEVYQVNLPSPYYSISDFISLITSWFHKGVGILSDINSDSIVNSKDLGIMMSKWN